MPATSTIPWRGVADREAMKVAAIAAASWNPFVKVNANASMSAATATGSIEAFRRSGSSG